MYAGEPADRLRKRLRIVRDADVDRGPARKLFDFLYRLMGNNEALRETPEDLDDKLPAGTARWEPLLERDN